MDKIPVLTGNMGPGDLIQLLKFVNDKVARLNLFRILYCLIGEGHASDYAEMDKATKRQYEAYCALSALMD